MARSLLFGGLGIGLCAGSALISQAAPIVIKRVAGLGKPRGLTRTITSAAKGAVQTPLTVEPERYPQVRRDATVVDVLHGVQIADPYRWLEDPDSEETQAFVEAQNKLTKEVLAQCDSKDAFQELFTKLYDYAKFSSPFKQGGRYYYYHNSGLQQHHVLYGQDSLDSPATVLLDPNTLSADGTIALKSTEFSDDGKLMAYSLSSGGSDWCTIQVMSIDDEGKAKVLDDKLEFVKFSSMAWTHDNKGFFYNRYPDPKGGAKDLGTETDVNTNQLLCYHVLGTKQSEDAVVYAMPEHPIRMCGASVTDDGRYLLLYVTEGCQPANRIFYVDLHLLERTPQGSLDFPAYDFNKGSKKLPVVKLVDNFDASYTCIANDGSVMYFLTNLNAPRYRVVKVDLASPGPPASWPDLVPQHEKDVLQSASALKGDNLVAMYLRDVKGVLQLRTLSTGALVRELPVPGVGSISGFTGDRKGTEFFFSFQSFADPGTTYRVDLAETDAAPHIFRRTELKVPHSSDEYQTTQVFVPSRDGTKVPMFITHRKGLELNGRNPTLLYGYGGFSISLEPSFSASRLAFMKGFNGVFALANLRGGGEYGTDWRDAGSLQNKQNVFDDFQACAQYLITSGYCSSSTLTIQGGSNGGLLVAACANQRPDLFACVLGQVGVMDMLRFHKFTIGHAWITDYGNPDIRKQFEYILPYSPLHNVAVPQEGAGQYPAILLSTGDHDDRVVPLHSHKLIATLQHELARAPANPGQRNPLLIRVDVRAGHGAGKPTKMVIAEVSELMGFAAKCMNAKWVL